MQVAVINYNAGNSRSVLFALERLGVNALLTDKQEDIASADKVIFPGVGEAGTTMKFLKERKLDRLIISLRQPVLGICLGMQLMCKHSEEGDTDCLGIFDAVVRKFKARLPLKVPQVGWNRVDPVESESSGLFTEISSGGFMYFIHSYYVEKNDRAIAYTDYDILYSSALQKDNFYAVQFHPEKSGETGQKLLGNFLKLE